MPQEPWIYVEAYDKSGNQILGTLDGQMAWKGSGYKRTIWYKNLANKKTLDN